MFTQGRELLHTWDFPDIDGKPYRILQGSDHHIPLGLADLFISAMKSKVRNKDADLVILNGDHFDAPDGHSTQEAVGRLLSEVGNAFPRQVIFVPGNHDLRGSGHDAWSKFGELPDNVIAPLDDPTMPVELITRAGKFLAGNIFYDRKFMPASLIGCRDEEITQFYRDELVDGRHLFKGDMSPFAEMTFNFAAKISPDVRFVVTHCLPHPALSAITTLALTTAAELLERDGFNVISWKKLHPSYGKTAVQWAKFWDKKALLMGSNLLEHPNASLKDGLVVFSGHNHKSENRFPRSIGGNNVVFCSYQIPFASRLYPFQWARSGVESPSVPKQKAPDLAFSGLHL